MKEFNFLVFLDDDHASNVYHEIVLDESQLCKNSKFFISPRKALEYFERLSLQEKPKLPEVIFLDINMPYMNGWEFLEKFRELNFTKFPKVVMLSSSNYPKDKEKGKDFPLIHSYLEKPLKEEHLIRILEDFYGS